MIGDPVVTAPFSSPAALPKSRRFFKDDLDAFRAKRRSTCSIALGGITILSRPRVTGDGYYEAVLADPEGNRIELMA